MGIIRFPPSQSHGNVASDKQKKLRKSNNLRMWVMGNKMK